jgi:site-specific DNA recombinase
VSHVNAVIYARISSDRGVSIEGLGVARQVEDCRALAVARGWTVVEEFIDNDVSASTGKSRPAYERMIEAFRGRRANGLVVWDLDRLTRQPRELEDFIDLADSYKVELASVGGEIDLGTEQGRMLARMKGNLAKYEVEQQSRRLKRKFLERAQEGKPHGKVAYGYRREPVLGDDGRIIDTVEVLHEAQAEVVRECTRRLLAGESVRRIVADLNAREVPTPRGHLWDGTMLRQVLRRQRNAGRRVHRGVVVGKGAWPPLLDEDTFDRVQALLSDPSRRTTRGNEVQHLLSGIARCGIEGCDGVMRVTLGRMNGGKQAPTSYNCRKCYRIRRKKADVDAVVERVVVARLSRPDGPDLLAGDPELLASARAAADTIRARLNLAADKFAGGEIDGDQLARITASLRPQLDARETEVRAASPAREFDRFAGREIAASWAEAELEVRRAVIARLMTVTLMPTGSGGTFDPASVQIKWSSSRDEL